MKPLQIILSLGLMGCWLGVWADDVDQLIPTKEELLITPKSSEKGPVLQLPADPTLKKDAEPNSKTPLKNGFALLGRGQFEEAVEIFDKVLEDDPKSSEARFGKGTSMIKLHRFKEALALLDPMTKEFPNNFLVKNNVAWLYATASDPAVRNGKKSIALAQEALLIRPENYHIWNTLSEAYYITGKYEKALRAAKEAALLARKKKASPVDIWNYSEQIAKCRRAVEANSILD